MLNYYRKRQIRDLFENAKLKNKDLELKKVSKKCYVFTVKDRKIFLAKTNKNKFYFIYDFFYLDEDLKEKFPVENLLKNNKNLIKVVKKYG